jgi:site-specific recombinase XerD
LEPEVVDGVAVSFRQSVKRFSAWLLATGQLPGDPFLGVKGPAQRRPILLPLSNDELRALIATCTNPVHRPGEALHHRRDEALIRLMLETGIRAGEVVALETARRASGVAIGPCTRGRRALRRGLLVLRA